MKRSFIWANSLILCTSAAALSIPLDARATGPYGDAGEAELVRPLLIKDANMLEEGDGSLSPAAIKAMNGGSLPASPTDIAIKAAANAVFDATTPATVASVEPKAEGLVLFGGAEVAAATPPSIVGGRSFQGQLDATFTPSDSAGAIGTTRYVQLVNRRFAIYSRTSAVPLTSGTLNAFASLSSTVKAFRPQVIWDPTTERFYYVMNATFSATDQRLAYGFSKTATPTTDADWCKYTLGNYGSLFPDFPRLGDTQHFAVVGVNVYNSASVFQRAEVLAIRKPATGSTCPTSVSFVRQNNLKDTSGNRIFSPTPANQIDTAPDGYIVARNLSLPSNRIWIFKVTRNATTGVAVIDAVGKALTLPFTTSIPPDATQGGLTQKIDTGDTRLTQAVLAINPLRGASAFSLWTQQTVANNGTSAVRAYEINPVPTTPSLRRHEIVTTPLGFVYNAAISPDRRVDGNIKAFGGSVVLAANASSAFLNIPPGIAMGSSVNGSTFYSGALVKAAIGPYQDSTCKTAGSICRWGDSSSAAPDPRPATTGTGAIWFTNQYSGFANPQTTQANWRTWIWAAKP